MQITTDVSKISKTVQAELIFISNAFSESTIHFAYLSKVLSKVLPKKMLLVSYEVVFIENEAVLLWETMRERARAFTATI